MIIGVLNQKGGVGKTTLSVNLAHRLAMEKKQVLVIDSDPQESAQDWVCSCDSPPFFHVVCYAKATLHKDMKRLSVGYEHVIIDGPPRDAEIMKSIIVASDAVLIPITPSPPDLWATEAVLELIDEAKEIGKNLKVGFVINRRIAHTEIERELARVLASYNRYVFRARITQRVIFAESAARGITVYEMYPGGPAAREIDALADELKEWMND